MSTENRSGSRPSARSAPRAVPPRGARPRAELILVGRELLRGDVADRNGVFLAQRLTERGAAVSRAVILDDDVQAVSSAIREALGREPHLVIVCGGLGPAAGDRTLAGVADALGLPLTLDATARSMVEESLRRLHRKRLVASSALTAVREKLFRIPVGSTPLANPRGLSPGVVCRLAGGAVVLCLPGQPNETRPIFDDAIEQHRLIPRVGIARRDVESPTSDETALNPLLGILADEFPHVWIQSQPVGPRESGNRTRIRLEALADTDENAAAVLDGVVKRLLALAAGSP